MPVLPPTAASTMPASVVGHLHHPHAAQPGRGDPAGEIGRRAAAEADDRVGAGEAGRAELVPAASGDLRASWPPRRRAARSAATSSVAGARAARPRRSAHDRRVERPRPGWRRPSSAVDSRRARRGRRRRRTARRRATVIVVLTPAIPQVVQARGDVRGDLTGRALLGVDAHRGDLVVDRLALLRRVARSRAGGSAAEQRAGAPVARLAASSVSSGACSTATGTPDATTAARVGVVGQRSPAERQHPVEVAREAALDRGALGRAERRLARRRRRSAGTVRPSAASIEIVRVGERHAHDLGQPPSGRRLAGARQPDEDDARTSCRQSRSGRVRRAGRGRTARCAGSRRPSRRRTSRASPRRAPSRPSPRRPRPRRGRRTRRSAG